MLLDNEAVHQLAEQLPLTLRFGGGEEFTIHMYDNDTANQIAEYVGTASWQLPIYRFDDYDGWESFQYYDIPRRYDIPDGSQPVASEKVDAVEDNPVVEGWGNKLVFIQP